MKQLESEMGQAVEMGTIHAGDFLVNTSSLYKKTFWVIFNMLL